MKKLTLFALMILSILAFTSCSQNELAEDVIVGTYNYYAGGNTGLITYSLIFSADKTVEYKIFREGETGSSRKGIYVYEHPSVIIIGEDLSGQYELSDDKKLLRGNSAVHIKQ